MEASPDDPSSSSPGNRAQSTAARWRGRVVVAAVAAGAFAAAGQSLAAGEGSASPDEDFSAGDAAGSLNTAMAADEQQQQPTHQGVGGSAPAPAMLPVAKSTDVSDEIEKITKSEQISAAREAARKAAEAEAMRPKYHLPALGNFTSGFGGRWGTTHYGIDIANSKGAPIYSAADGVVIEAGPASGFGMWVRVQHDDGYISVYGHVNSILVSEGERVKAGEEIATMGNRGFSTGPHLHFEIWNSNGKKINPLPWMREHDIDPTS
ncbi:M23 family metallopeptidase [Saccharopolyspora griseoalba]|uniref:M23 family metallopeptidase n=1 Tax=Saccharopolyspora griseoalba TaxID=1431848 RepID=A0ABW2LKE0_9PSEU